MQGRTDPAGFIEPAYSRRSLCDVVPAVAVALGRPIQPDPPSGLVLPSAPSYVVFLVDGLGSRLIERHREAAPFLAALLDQHEAGTAGVPSTTATSLTSLGTGLTPGQHGLVGFTSRVPGTERLLNALFWDKEVDPVEWQPNPTAFARLQDVGVTVTVVNKPEFAGSGLTLVSSRGVEYVGAAKAGERIAAALAGAAVAPSFTYLYDSDLDWTGHKYGVDSPQWLQQLAMVDAEVEQLRAALPSATRLVILADHGMVDAPAEHRVDVDQHPGLREGLLIFGGEARFRHLYCTAGAVDDVVATWRGVLGERATVLTREEVIARGWFGQVQPGVLPRLGDVMVACHGDAAVVSTVDFGYEDTLVGMHGSLTSTEMLIPILVG
jgi:hypothetical protein